MNRLLPLLSTVTLLGTLALASPAAGEFNADALIAQVNSHEARISDLEQKTDATQSQVNQNTADVQVLQESTGTAPAPAVEPVSAPVAQSEPAPVQTASVQPVEPAPRTVVSVDRLVRDTNIGIRTFCTYKYSDGRSDAKSLSGDVECPAQP